MRILVDTSVWSLALRRKGGAVYPEVKKLESLILDGEQLFIIGLILQEILQGISRSDKFEKLKDYLSAFPMLRLDREDYIIAAQLRNQCRSKGVEAGTVDFLIASTAITHNCYLFTTDNDFQYIAEYSKLMLL